MTNPEIQAVLAGESDGCVVCAFSLGRLVAAPAAGLIRKTHDRHFPD